jgi:hypothetical protein
VAKGLGQQGTCSRQTDSGSEDCELGLASVRGRPNAACLTAGRPGQACIQRAGGDLCSGKDVTRTECQLATLTGEYSPIRSARSLWHEDHDDYIVEITKEDG